MLYWSCITVTDLWLVILSQWVIKVSGCLRGKGSANSVNSSPLSSLSDIHVSFSNFLSDSKLWQWKDCKLQPGVHLGLSSTLRYFFRCSDPCQSTRPVWFMLDFFFHWTNRGSLCNPGEFVTFYTHRLTPQQLKIYNAFVRLRLSYPYVLVSKKVHKNTKTIKNIHQTGG